MKAGGSQLPCGAYIILLKCFLLEFLKVFGMFLEWIYAG
jgi:hypothetical protein